MSQGPAILEVQTPMDPGPEEETFDFRPLSVEMEAQVTRVQAVARGRKARSEALKNKTEEQRQMLFAAQQTSELRRNFFREVDEVLGVSKAVYNSSAGLQEAHGYLQRHNIQQLLESLLARAALERPPDLREFLAEVLMEMIKSRGQPSMGLFTEQDLSTMFDMWDDLKTGTIPVYKVAESLTALNCSVGREKEAVEAVVGADCSQVDRETFMKIVRSELEMVYSSPTV
uniref:EF-hand domain-containing protein n=1 Tax=Alexandrium catenella TaxID=2925 RepID=A0A7S1R0Z8_ALECA